MYNWNIGRIPPMHKQQRQFTPEFNLAVIRLIKHKFLPLQRAKASLHHHRNSLLSPNTSSSSCHLDAPHSLPSFHTKIIAERPQNQQGILEKAKQYIDNNRRRPNRVERTELKEYIQLFEKPIELKGRGKRQSIEFNLMQMESRHKLQPLAAVSLEHQALELNQEQRSIMNAKIRRKLNHRKIIDLAKRY